MKTTSALLCVLVCVGLVSMASGALSITNGDFQAGTTGSVLTDLADVPGWYESNDHAEPNFWTKPWFKEADGEGMVVFTGSQVGPAIDGAGLLGYVYQNIGTADGASEVTIGFQSSWETDYGMTLTILESDGSFVPGEEVDVLGAAGTTMIAQQTQLYTGAAEWYDNVWTLDLSSAGAGDLYLRFNEYLNNGVNPGNTWAGLDNVAIVPEPATMSLLAIGGLALIRRRKRA